MEGWVTHATFLRLRSALKLRLTIKLKHRKTPLWQYKGERLRKRGNGACAPQAEAPWKLLPSHTCHLVYEPKQNISGSPKHSAQFKFVPHARSLESLYGVHA